MARQIAEALIAAHEKSIVHRDLKPANIALTPGGVVKVLDFGLAKLATTPASAIDQTRTVDATREGLVVGTGAYMSPEQARGQAVDARTDIWAFGCVLYEMLAGRAPFARTTLSDTIAAVIEREPDWRPLPSATPDNVRRLLRRCLQKDSGRRLADMRDARLELDDEPGDEHVRPAARNPWIERIAWIGALLVVSAAAVLLLVRSWQTVAPETRTVRFDIPSPLTREATSIAMSPDARRIVFAASSNNRTMLWLHSIEAGSARPLAGTDGARYPFWSPDNRSVGFFAEAKLKRIDLDSGTVIPLTDARGFGGGGAWHADGTIAFVPIAGPLLRISSKGGNATPVQSTVGLGPVDFPRFLPGTRRVLFSTRGLQQGLYVAELDGPDRQRLADRAPATATAETLLFIRDRKLFAQRFDIVTLELSGTPTQIASDVTAVSVADEGSIVYRSGAALEPELTWFDRSGTELGRARERGTSPSISHDGRRVAMMRTASPGEAGEVNPGVWTWDLEADRFSRIVAAPPVGNTPIWSWDDTRVVFSSPRNGQQFGLYEKRANGAGTDEPLLQTDQAVFANDWSRDGVLIFRSSDPKTGGFDLWTLSRKDGQQQRLVAAPQFDEREAQFSPDGRWFAYQSNESGQHEIYIAPFPNDGRERIGPVSVNGGTQVRWNSNGKELFYLSKDNRLMSVPIVTSGNGPLIEAGRPVSLFQTHILEAGVAGHQYVVSRDGLRFLILTTQEAVTPITVILN